MSEHNNDQITQKDLLKLLFDQAQHNATREEVQAVQEEIKETNKRFDGLATREDLLAVEYKLQTVEHKLESKIDSSIDSLRKEVKEDNQSLRSELKGDMKSLEKRLDRQDAQIAKLDNRLWWIAGLIVALAFKSEIFALFQG
ncbi:hypothetical protein [uncultured Vibrio sp.]|uniref:hypothetical protein n=1 Tax=uncultured Vibrio sp. TaxID=114054 RepID=UPI00262DB324|nr:hypothetical protein [uncultured Vibrio sp.]